MSATSRSLPPRYIVCAVPLVVIVMITWTYWPVHTAGLVWDDVIFLRDAGGLRRGNTWLEFALHGFDNWLNYFRPLGVALFAAETRLFDVAPGPMHLLSLGLHLINTLLVGALSRAVAIAWNHRTGTWLLSTTAMLVFGLHPALVEPVVWIASQFELLLTLFMLLGLLANISIRHRIVRAVVVASCFFLAACSKEAAVTFPLLLLTMDWSTEPGADDRPRHIAAKLLNRQWPVYLAVLIAGIAYLAGRYWGLGFLMSSHGLPMSLSWPRLNAICFTYLAYWKLVVWPMTGLGPIHIIPSQQFADFTATTAATDAASLIIALTALYLLWKRRPLGALVAGVTATLLPVLHVIPIEFDESIYHERYAMMAVAVASIFLPIALTHWLDQGGNRRLAPYALLGTAGWLLAAAINVRVTIPLWSDEAKLWEWALRQNPGSIVAQDHLLSSYLDRNDYARAEPIAKALEKDGKNCATCMLKIASLAVTQGNSVRAAEALQEVRRAVDAQLVPQRLVAGYLLVSGNLSRLQNDSARAESYYRGAIQLGPLNPHGYMSLAMLLAHESKSAEARKAADAALSLYAPDERDQRRREFERAIATHR